MLSGMELTTVHMGVYGGEGRRGTDPPGNDPDEVGMEWGPAGFGREERRNDFTRQERV